jgi:hypothetical protein
VAASFLPVIFVTSKLIVVRHDRGRRDLATTVQQ